MCKSKAIPSTSMHLNVNVQAVHIACTFLLHFLFLLWRRATRIRANWLEPKGGVTSVLMMIIVTCNKTIQIGFEAPTDRQPRLSSLGIRRAMWTDRYGEQTRAWQCLLFTMHEMPMMLVVFSMNPWKNIARFPWQHKCFLKFRNICFGWLRHVKVL